MPTPRLFGRCVLALWIACASSGCSVIGLGIGGAMDRSAPRTFHPGESADALHAARLGTLVRLDLADSTRVTGTFEGWESAASGAPPAVRLQVEGRPRVIPARAVVAVSRAKRRYGALGLGLAGLALDVFAVRALIELGNANHTF